MASAPAATAFYRRDLPQLNPESLFLDGKPAPDKAETGRSCFGSLKAQTMREDCRPAAKPLTAVNVPRP